MVRELLIYTAPTLKRLIVDMPLRSLFPRDDRQGVKKILNEGFERLVNLEELVSVKDQFFLPYWENGQAVAFWTHFPKLRRLAVYVPCSHADTNIYQHVPY